MGARNRTERVGGSGGGDPLLQAALASMPYGFSIWDEAHRLVLYNRRYLAMYGLPEDGVMIGMTLREMSELTLSVGNHPGFTAEELTAVYAQRMHAATDPNRAVRAQKAIRDRVIKTSHIRAPGLGWVVTHEDVTAEVELIGLAEAREAALEVRNRLFEAAIGNMTTGLSMFDAEWRLLVCNQRYVDLYAIPPELTRPGTPFKAIMAHREASGTASIELDDAFAEAVLEANARGRARSRTYRLANGRIVAVVQCPIPQGGFLATHQDITEDIEQYETLKAQQEALSRQNLRFDAAVNNISQGLCMFDAEERLVICNSAYARIYNLPPELMERGTTLSEILTYRFDHGMVPVGGRENYVQGRKSLVVNRAFAKDIIEMEDGRAIAIRHHPMKDGGWVATHEDVTEQRQNEARVHHLARHDALTGLPNRMLFNEEMAKAETRIRRGEITAVLCVDLDHFKAVNDTHGHAVGDAVLGAVAVRLRQASRETDLVSRLGGDEFALLLSGLDAPAGAALVASRIVKSLAEPIVVEGRHVLIGGSVGISVAPTDGESADALLKNADLALYRAKSEGRGNYHFFEKGMDQALQHRRMLESGLRSALAGGQFRLVFQPLVALSTNRISCLEALLRWDHPELGLVPPDEFIPLAEESGVIVPIGEWVLREACRAAAAWPDDVRVAVNLSTVQFRNRALFNQVTTALRNAGLDPRRLELEVTESLLLADSELTLDTLHRMRALGISISMDDFGTGYSSLSYLRSFPFDKIKIDRSFMRGLTPDAGSLAIIKAVVGLGQSLGMSTVAEGVETEEQLVAVRAEGCNEVQGFLFSAPLPASGVEALLASRGQARPKTRARQRRRA